MSISHCLHQWLMLSKSLISLIAELNWSSTMSIKDVSSAYRNHVDDTLTLMSLIYTRKSNSPSTEPCGTPVSMFNQLELCPSITILSVFYQLSSDEINLAMDPLFLSFSVCKVSPYAIPYQTLYLNQGKPFVLLAHFLEFDISYMDNIDY